MKYHGTFSFYRKQNIISHGTLSKYHGTFIIYREQNIISHGTLSKYHGTLLIKWGKKDRIAE